MALTCQCGCGLFQDKQQTLISAKLLCWGLQNFKGTHRTQIFHHKKCACPPLGGTITDENDENSFLNDTFINIISMCSLNNTGFCDIGPSHLCCIFFRTPPMKHDLHETLHIVSPDVSDQKNLRTTKIAQSKESQHYNNYVFCKLKNTLFYILAKLRNARL